MRIGNAPPAVCFTAPAAPSFTIAGVPLSNPFGDSFGGISFLAGETREAERRKEGGCARHPTTSVTGTSACTKARYVPQATLLKTRHDAVEASSVPFDGDVFRRSAATFTIRDPLPFGRSSQDARVREHEPRPREAAPRSAFRDRHRKTSLDARGCL